MDYLVAMKLLITGSNGFVGGGIIAAAPQQWELHGIGRSATPAASSVNYHQLDLLDAPALADLLQKVRPDVIIHSAAIANIDFCESNKDAATAINVDSTADITEIAGRIGARLIFCSTDTVFDGKKGNYTETDTPTPVNFYGETKVRAEQIVHAGSKHHLVARLSLVMGWPVIGDGNTFLPDLVGRLQRGDAANFAYNEVRSPIDVLTLGEALVELAHTPVDGIIHLSGSTAINRFDMAKKAARLAGYPEEAISSVNSNSFAGRAPRPDDASMNNEKARTLLRTKLLDIDAGLARCFAQPAARAALSPTA